METRPLLLLLIFYLPGALMFRLPWWQRERRAELAAEERVFWHVVLSLAWALSVVLVLAALEQYRFERLLLASGALAVLLALWGGRRLAYTTRPRRLTWTVALPLILLALGGWRFFPSSEYIIGGKDPGTYISQGVQIAQRGTLIIHDPVIAAVPEHARDLFFPKHPSSDYYGTRFMGFFLRDPNTGDVTGQFLQLLPISMAIGYGVDGLTGVRMTTGVWALLGMLALYFLGARLVGRPAAAAAAGLLALNVAEVWFARYPNSEVALQALLFASLLAFARAHQDDDRFFSPVAAVLIGLALFTRIETPVIVAAMLGAGVLAWLVKASGPLRPGFVVCLMPWLVAGWFYYAGPMRPYVALPLGSLRQLSALEVTTAIAALVLVLAVLAVFRKRFAQHLQRAIPLVIAAVLTVAAIYAAFFREPAGRLAAHDAYALRSFTELYLLWPGLAAAIIGLVLVVRREFWRDPAFILVFGGLSLIFFYKIRVVPTEFWAARRFLPVILPGALLFAAAAGLGPPAGRQWVRRAAGLALVGVLGWQYAARAAPVVPHVEYAGVIPALERLASHFGDRDLVLVESRDAGSDTHVLALPLAYIYARPVLVLNSARPDKLRLRLFLEDALQRYEHVYFVGGGGTDLLSRRIAAQPVTDAQLKVPEFESTEDTLPSSVRRKDFDYTVYELTLDGADTESFSLDLGERDDLNVVRFHAKETNDDRTIRWTGPQSSIAIPSMTGAEREVVLVMHDGGRPPAAPQAHVEIHLNGAHLGGADVGQGFQEYRFPIPAETAAGAAAAEEPAQLTLVSNVWSPRDLLGIDDGRQLGVMVDRVEVR
jgi:hypothetical protein